MYSYKFLEAFWQVTKDFPYIRPLRGNVTPRVPIVLSIHT